ncbi:RNA polymerase sigma factor [Lachnotalea sp. AF33-28]|uniref:RNA polymerase sigma factor n=1 Tax=Lachnotalea sp. AF33-28 TaxID=2292046 RepID=UPI000E5531E2|nr:sigma-70 family RNA polymerase sigma factor [Lachnotalea sp. AF33-28]RHP30795.1 sigma-70 family RNA polymerase sigma factor [Lachnotalea sp. AF33-28]
MNDQSILELYWNRNESAIRETSKRYGTYCFSIAHNILKNREDSDECVNDTWLHAWNAIPPARPGRLASYLGRITRNLSINRYKLAHAKKRGGGVVTVALEELMECIPDGQEPCGMLELEELAGAINSFLYTLPERDRCLMLGRYWYVEPVKHLAGRFGLSENNVKVILHRSRVRLKEYLEKEGVTV